MVALDDVYALADEERQVIYAVQTTEYLLKVDCRVDVHTLREALSKARDTIKHEPQVKGPDEIKQAAHKAFWVRKLKPFSAEFVENKPPADGKGEMIGYMYLNELAALLFGMSILEMYGHKPIIHLELCHDFVTSMRYSSYSPSSMRTIFQVLCNNGTHI